MSVTGCEHNASGLGVFEEPILECPGAALLPPALARTDTLSVDGMFVVGHLNGLSVWLDGYARTGATVDQEG